MDDEARRSDDSTFQLETECWKAMVRNTAPTVKARVALNHAGLRALKTIRDVKKVPRTKRAIDAAIHEFARSVLRDTKPKRKAKKVRKA